MTQFFRKFMPPRASIIILSDKGQVLGVTTEFILAEKQGRFAQALPGGLSLHVIVEPVRYELVWSVSIPIRAAIRRIGRAYNAFVRKSYESHG